MEKRKLTSAEKWKRRVAGGLIGILGVTGLSACSPAKTEVPGPAPTASAPATTGEQTPTPSPSETAPTNEIQNYSSYKESPEYAALTAEQKAEIDRMDALDFDTYNVEQDAKQFAYAEFMVGVYKPYAIEMLEENQIVASDARLSYNPSYFASFDSETLKTPAQQIESNFTLATAVSILSMTNGDATVVNADESKLRAKKMLSYVFVKGDLASPAHNHGDAYYNVLQYIDSIGDTLDTDPSTPGFEQNGYVIQAVPTYSAVKSNPNYSNGPAEIMFYTRKVNGVDKVVRLISYPVADAEGSPVEKWRIDDIGDPGQSGFNYDAIATS